MTTDGTTDDGPSRAGADERDADGRLVVDALGLACPRPILELAAAMKGLAVGDEILLLADDPAAKVDVPAWARMKRQQVLSLDEVDREIRIAVRKRTDV